MNSIPVLRVKLLLDFFTFVYLFLLQAVGGGKAVKRTACPRKVRKDGAGPSKKGGSPKGFKSAYTMFMTTEGPRIRQELRNRPELEDNHNFSRYVGQLWRAMTDVEKVRSCNII